MASVFFPSFYVKWFGALSALMALMALSGVLIFPNADTGLLGLNLAAIISSVAQWVYFRRHAVSVWWHMGSLAILPLIEGTMWGAWRIGVPLFYTDPPMFHVEPGRPLWTWGWWTVGMGIVGLLLGAVQWLFLRGKVSRSWCWPLVSTVAWACLGAAKTEPWSRGPWIGLAVGPLAWAAVMVLGFALTQDAASRSPVSAAANEQQS